MGVVRFGIGEDNFTDYDVGSILSPCIPGIDDIKNLLQPETRAINKADFIISLAKVP